MAPEMERTQHAGKLPSLWPIALLAALLLPQCGHMVTTHTAGLVTTTNCSHIANPKANKTWCFQRSDGQMYYWDGSTWSAPLLQGALPSSTAAGLPAPCTDGQLARVTDDIRGVWTCEGNAWHSVTGEADISDFGAVCDNATDDSAAIQAALAAGTSRRVAIHKGACVVNSADLTVGSNTTLHVATGATLNLSGTRLMAVGAGIANVHIIVDGTIQSLALNSGDAFPAGWGWLGAINMGGTAASPGSDLSVTGSGKLVGQWSGAPGDSTDSKKCGIVGQFIRNMQVFGPLDISGFVGEAVTIGSIVNAASAIGPGLHIHHTNQDGANISGPSWTDSKVIGNSIDNASTGIEVSSGVVEGNTIQDVNTCFGFSGQGDGAFFRKNICKRATLTASASHGASLTPTSLSTTLVLDGNDFDTVNSSCINVAGSGGIYAADVTLTNNTCRGWGAANDAPGFNVANLDGAYISGNKATAPGAHGTIGYAIGGSVSNLTWGTNYSGPAAHTDPTYRGAYAGLEVSMLPSPLPLAGNAATSPTSGTGEDTLNTYNHKADSLGYNGGYHVIAAGAVGGTNNTKTVKLYFGATTVVTLSFAAGDQLPWRIESWITWQRTQTNEIITTLAYKDTTVAAMTVAAATQDAKTDLDIRLTGEVANSSDSVTCYQWLVQPILVGSGN